MSATERSYTFAFLLYLASECSATLTSQTGVIMSPNYPGVYHNKKDCTWKVIVRPGSHVELTFRGKATVSSVSVTACHAIKQNVLAIVLVSWAVCVSRFSPSPLFLTPQTSGDNAGSLRKVSRHQVVELYVIAL